MESSNMAMKSSLIAWLFLSLLSIAHSYTSFQDCYGTCVVTCAVTPGIPISECPKRCFKTCWSKTANIVGGTQLGNNQFSCVFDCAIPSCTKFSTKEDPAAEKVGRCVDSCSHGCIKI
uniref:Thionin-like protein 2 n=1 Tax=Cucumis melo TaxID=3656 RepID=A0A9I9DSY9_CUCME